MRTVHRNQAEIEAKEFSQRENSIVTVYKIADGRYEVSVGYDEELAGAAIAQFENGKQMF